MKYLLLFKICLSIMEQSPTVIILLLRRGSWIRVQEINNDAIKDPRRKTDKILNDEASIKDESPYLIYLSFFLWRRGRKQRWLMTLALSLLKANHKIRNFFPIKRRVGPDKVLASHTSHPWLTFLFSSFSITKWKSKCIFIVDW